MSKDFPGIDEVYEKVQVMNSSESPLAVSLPPGLASASKQDDIITHLNTIALSVSTAANQAIANGSLVSIDGKVLTNAQLRASPVPVSGPLTNTELRAAAIPISAATLPLPNGAATAQNITDLSTALINSAYNLVAAQIIPVATTTFTVTVDPKFPHTFLGVIPCDSSGVYTASATGSVAVTVESVNAPGVLQTPAEATISMAAPADVSFGGNLLSVRGTVTGLASTHYRVSVSQNKA